MVLGQYSVKVGGKYRVAFPKKFKDEFGTKLIITHGFEKSLFITSYLHWKEVLKDIVKGSILEPETRDVKRFLIGGAREIELDSQGRFVLPKNLREFAKIEKEVVFVGLGTYAEVWETAIWKDYQEMMNIQMRETARRLAERIRG